MLDSVDYTRCMGAQDGSQELINIYCHSWKHPYHTCNDLGQSFELINLQELSHMAYVKPCLAIPAVPKTSGINFHHLKCICCVHYHLLSPLKCPQWPSDLISVPLWVRVCPCRHNHQPHNAARYKAPLFYNPHLTVGTWSSTLA